jgi:hypothetical protein
MRFSFLDQMKAIMNNLNVSVASNLNYHPEANEPPADGTAILYDFPLKTIHDVQTFELSLHNQENAKAFVNI